MGSTLPLLELLADARLALHATSPLPAWLWSTDGTQVLWSNAVGAAVVDPRALPPAAQIAQLTTILRQNGTPRLARLRGFGGGIGRLVTCECASITVTDGQCGILIAAAEAIGPTLPLAERAAQLLADVDEPIAAFGGDHSLLHVTDSAKPLLKGCGTLEDLPPAGIDATLELGIGADAVTVCLLKTAVGRPQVDSVAVPVSPGEPANTQATPEPPRRHPLRFVWQMDADGLFTISSDEFAEIIGPRTTSALGKSWNDTARTLALDPEGQVAAAVATRDTWSDITVSWPLDGSTERLPVELSGLPAFDRNRSFLGYRGFGVCRDVERIAALFALRRAAASLAAVESHAKIEPKIESKIEPKAEPTPVPPASARRSLTTIGTAENVVPFRPLPANDMTFPELNPVERNAFGELARELNARLTGSRGDLSEIVAQEAGHTAIASEPSSDAAKIETVAPDDTVPPVPAWLEEGSESRAFLDRLPIGLILHRLDMIVFTNRAALDLLGFASLDALREAGGLDALLIEPGPNGDADALSVAGQTGGKIPIASRMIPVPWNDESAHALVLTPAQGDRTNTDRTGREHVVLNAITQGIMVFGRDGRIVLANRHAEFLLGYAHGQLNAVPFANLFAPESKRIMLDYIDAIAQSDRPDALTEGREVVGRVLPRGLVPLHVTIQPIGMNDEFFAICRDITQAKTAEAELADAKRLSEKARGDRLDFIAKLGRELRAPLTSIGGFSEIMLGEQFGPIGSDRYRDYLADIRKAADQVLGLIDGLHDLSKVEAGKLDLSFAPVNLQELVQSCMAEAQPKASRARVLIRNAVSATGPKVMTDAQTARQVVSNLLAHAIGFTGPGGQVIVSTTLRPDGDVTLRIRDTGTGLTEDELRRVLQPFGGGPDTTVPSLSLTKALADAVHALFSISSKVDDGTLIELTFPSADAMPMTMPAQ